MWVNAISPSRHLLRPSPFFQQLPWSVCEALAEQAMELECLAAGELLAFKGAWKGGGGQGRGRLTSWSVRRSPLAAC